MTAEDGKLSLSSCFPARKLDICFHVSLISIKNAAAETNDDTEAERIKDSSPRPVKVRRAETKIVPRSQEEEISQDIDFECLIARTRVTPASILTALINK